MPPDSSSFTALNIPNDAVPEWMGSFTLSASPNTDLWRKPPSRDTSTAPILYTALRNPFIAAEVTVSGDWELEWDQGGLVIFAGAPPGRLAAAAAAARAAITTTSTSETTSNTTTSTPRGAVSAAAAAAAAAATTSGPLSSTPHPSPSPHTPSSTNPSPTSHAGPPPTPTGTTVTQPTTAPNPNPNADTISNTNANAIANDPPPSYTPQPPTSKWLKVGLEFCNNACHATSVCATSDGADWSLTALPPHHARRSDLRVKIERIGYALWVWYEDEVSGWKKLREVTWFFWGVEDKAVRVGVYASRPANFGVSVWERRNGGAGGSGGSGGGGGGTGRNLCVAFEGLEIF